MFPSCYVYPYQPSFPFQQAGSTRHSVIFSNMVISQKIYPDRATILNMPVIFHCDWKIAFLWGEWWLTGRAPRMCSWHSPEPSPGSRGGRRGHYFCSSLGLGLARAEDGEGPQQQQLLGGNGTCCWGPWAAQSPYSQLLLRVRMQLGLQAASPPSPLALAVCRHGWCL